jgi:hypothetical protein
MWRRFSSGCEEAAVSFRAASMREYYPIAGLVIGFQIGWMLLMLYVLPWLAHSWGA